MKIKLEINGETEAKVIITALSSVSFSNYRDDKTKKVAYTLLKKTQIETIRAITTRRGENAR